jgi:hypothetical protein
MAGTNSVALATGFAARLKPNLEFDDWAIRLAPRFGGMAELSLEGVEMLPVGCRGVARFVAN